MKTRSSQPIQMIRRRYRQEWLLIDVQKLDEATTTPTHGRLLAHSKDREDIYNRLLQTRVRLPLVTYSEDAPPKGYAVAF
jgi:hypothetical protein